MPVCARDVLENGKNKAIFQTTFQIWVISRKMASCQWKTHKLQVRLLEKTIIEQKKEIEELKQLLKQLLQEKYGTAQQKEKKKQSDLHFGEKRRRAGSDERGKSSDHEEDEDNGGDDRKDLDSSRDARIL